MRFEPESEVTSVSSMLVNETKHPKRAGQKAGWKGLRYNAKVAYQTSLSGPDSKLLTVGRVLANYVEEEVAVLQPYRACWENLLVVHKPQYQTRSGLVDDPEPGPAREEAKARVNYDCIRFEVDLLQAGNLQLPILVPAENYGSKLG